jgi:hypothetical protein
MISEYLGGSEASPEISKITLAILEFLTLIGFS